MFFFQNLTFCSVPVATMASSFASRMFTSRKMALASLAGVGGVVAVVYAEENRQHARNWHSNGHMKYPASANFPDLTKHNNAIKKFLTPGVRLFTHCPVADLGGYCAETHFHQPKLNPNHNHNLQSKQEFRSSKSHYYDLIIDFRRSYWG